MFLYPRLLALAVSILLALPFALLAWVLRLCGARASGLQLAAFVQSLWARGSLFALGVRLETSGARRPANATLIAANHLSYLDILVLSAVFPSRFVAKSEIGRWPLVGQIVALSGTLFVKRGDRNDIHRVVTDMRQTLAAGVSVTFFPEGWASRGLFVRHFHRGLFEAAGRGGFPCLPVALSYATPAGTGAPAWTVAWWGPVPLFPHLLRLLREGPVVASVSWAAEPIVGTDRKQLALALEEEVRIRFVPLRQEPRPLPIKGDPPPEEGLTQELR